MKKNKKLTISVAIPTYYGGPALVAAVKSILHSKDAGEFRLIVSVDGNPLQKDIEKQLKSLGVNVINNKKRGGQIARIKQMIRLTKTDILILTQDDVKFHQNAILSIVKQFGNDPSLTMIGANVLPAKASTFFEKIVEVGVILTHLTGQNWRGGDNYLLASGRCLAFRTNAVKKFLIPDEVINSDAYLYFENKRLGGKFKFLPTAIVYNKSPQTLKEHVKQSKKFQNSLDEITRYIKNDVTSEYKIPLKVKLFAYTKQVIKNPLLTILYLLVFTYTRTHKNMYKSTKRFWQTDISTKRI